MLPYPSSFEPSLYGGGLCAGCCHGVFVLRFCVKLFCITCTICQSLGFQRIARLAQRLSETGRMDGQNRPFYYAKQAILHLEMACSPCDGCVLYEINQ